MLNYAIIWMESQPFFWALKRQEKRLAAALVFDIRLFVGGALGIGFQPLMRLIMFL